jgi:hypothetical protein
MQKFLVLFQFHFIIQWLFSYTVVLIESKTWIWQGALTSTSIRFAVKTDEIDEFHLVATNVFQPKSLSFARLLPETAYKFDSTLDYNNSNGFSKLTTKSFHMVLEDLSPNSTYTWSATGDVEGKFRTPPKYGTPFNFTFTFGSCADNDSNHEIFSRIPELQDPLFFVHMGDLHYGNLEQDRFEDFVDLFDRTLLQPNQAKLYQTVPTVYMWDDHDYGPNSMFLSNWMKYCCSSD